MDVAISTAIFVLLCYSITLVVLHEIPHTLNIYNFINVKMVQSGDDIIYLAR